MIASKSNSVQRFLYRKLLDTFPDSIMNEVKDKIYLTSYNILKHDDERSHDIWIIVYIGDKKEFMYSRIIDNFLGRRKFYTISTNFISVNNRIIYNRRSKTIEEFFASADYTIECCLFNNKYQYYTHQYLNAYNKRLLQTTGNISYIKKTFDIVNIYHKYQTNISQYIRQEILLYIDGRTNGRRKLRNNTLVQECGETKWTSCYFDDINKLIEAF